MAIWGAEFNASDAGWMHGELNGRTVDSILGYMSSLPTWAFHGAAYGMGDFSNASPSARGRARALPPTDPRPRESERPRPRPCAPAD